MKLSGFLWILLMDVYQNKCNTSIFYQSEWMTKRVNSIAGCWSRDRAVGDVGAVVAKAATIPIRDEHSEGEVRFRVRRSGCCRRRSGCRGPVLFRKNCCFGGGQEECTCLRKPRRRCSDLRLEVKFKWRLKLKRWNYLRKANFYKKNLTEG